MRCIYCLSDAGPATHRPHILPEGILRNDITLPIGAECDQCGHANGRHDKALLMHNRIWTVVMMHRLPGKTGRPRSELTPSFSVLPNGNWRIRVLVSMVKQDEQGVKIEVPDPPEYSEYRFRRGLHHMAFNYLARKLGVDAVTTKEFDSCRHYVRRAKPKESWPYVQTMYPDESEPRQLRLTLMEDAPGHLVRWQCFRDDFYVNVTQPESLHEWAAVHLPASGRL